MYALLLQPTPDVIMEPVNTYFIHLKQKWKIEAAVRT